MENMSKISSIVCVFVGVLFFSNFFACKAMERFVVPVCDASDSSDIWVEECTAFLKSVHADLDAELGKDLINDTIVSHMVKIKTRCMMFQCAESVEKKGWLDVLNPAFILKQEGRSMSLPTENALLVGMCGADVVKGVKASTNIAYRFACLVKEVCSKGRPFFESSEEDVVLSHYELSLAYVGITCAETCRKLISGGVSVT